MSRSPGPPYEHHRRRTVAAVLAFFTPVVDDPYDFGRIATAIIRAEGAITLAGLRDELHALRKFAQALLEYLDADRLTHRRPDNSPVCSGGGKTLSD